MDTPSPTKHLCILMVLAAFLATAGVCNAESKAFKAHVEQAGKYVDEAKYDQAINEYQVAYALNPAPWLLINIGRTHYRADRPREALDYYNQALKSELSSRDREGVMTSVAKATIKLQEQERKKAEEQRASDQARIASLPALQALPEKPPERPFYKKAWFWGTVGGIVAVGVGVGLTVGLLSRNNASQTTTPPMMPADGSPAF